MQLKLDISLTLREEEEVPTVRRRTCAAAKTCDFPDGQVDDIAVCVTELAGNGITHGVGTVTVQAGVKDRCFWLSVTNLERPSIDADREHAQPDSDVPPLAEHGRGLEIVRGLMDLHTSVVTTPLAPVWIVQASMPLPATADAE